MKKILIGALALVAGMTGAGSLAHANAQAELFAGKAVVAPHLHVESAAQFLKWSGKPVSQDGYDPIVYKKTRLGTVAFSAELRVHVDLIRDLVHFPSYYELVDARSGALLGKYPVFDLDDGEWYFSGNGMAYLNQTHLELCGPRYTRKIAQKGKGLVEVVQPLLYLGAETDVESTTQLYESPSSKQVVATVVPGTKITVLGILPGVSESSDMAYLVKTPFGLTGWHLPKQDRGTISIYQCN
ncbi:SH3 domain-containing protein [Pseudoduganella violaceinigra]|uniref:SH3 domain-containing protein n=1 Tax=Pseudoduganella violaceinigra TaxID=246602 RepID=UPI0012B63E0F|nr:SH3 domain-containing protein [Pseudoduganella violaceinigra]